MKVFCDYHHDDLYLSLQLLFRRLGWELYRPIGVNWFNEGYWKIAEPYGNDRGTVFQYLGIRDEVYQLVDGSRPLNNIKEKENGYYIVKGNPIEQRAVTFEQFKNIDFDIIIASYAPHVTPFLKLRDKFQKNAKVIQQMGNNWPVHSKVKNLMASTLPFPTSVHSVFYHQEFDTDIFSYSAPHVSKTISSFVNVLRKSDLKMFLALERELDWKFRAYGGGNRDGAILGHENIARKIRESQFIFHLKRGGDGFGHIIHNAFACGRAPIVKMSQYKGQLAGKLMEDGVTCIDIDGLSPLEAADKVLEYCDVNKLVEISDNAYIRFKSMVNYDKEFEELKRFFNDLR